MVFTFLLLRPDSLQGVGIHQEELNEKHAVDFSKAFKEAFLLLLNVINRVYVNKPAN